MGALEAPQDRHGQEHRTGTSRVETDNSEAMAELAALEAMAVQGAQEAMVELGALEAMADGLRGPWPRSSRPGPYSRNSYTPPQNFPGKVRGYQEPSGAKHTTWQYKTRQERPPGPDRQDRTATEPEALLGLAWRLRLPPGMTRSQRPSQGPSATASISTTGGQAARMASMATKQGAACPRRVSMDKT